MAWSNPSRGEVLTVAQATGCPVVEAWSDWNKGNMGTVVGPMLHHTGSDWSFPKFTAPTLKVVREGRADLQNSLCMYYIDYAGTIYCINNKLSWHAGGGSWQGVTDGNGHYAGIEAESDGSQWTAATMLAYKKLAAEILHRCGNSTAYAPRHKDYALPVGRKNDFSGYSVELFIADVEKFLYKASTTTEDDDMPSLLVYTPESGIWTLDQIGYHHIGDPATVTALSAAGYKTVKISQGEHYNWLASASRSELPLVCEILNADNTVGGYFILSGAGYSWVKDGQTVTNLLNAGATKIQLPWVEHVNFSKSLSADQFDEVDMSERIKKIFADQKGATV